MNAKFDLNYALRAIAWGFAHVAERYVMETCIAIIAIGLVALYAIATNSLLMGFIAVALFVLLCVVLNRYGMKVGPPSDNDPKG